MTNGSANGSASTTPQNGATETPTIASVLKNSAASAPEDVLGPSLTNGHHSSLPDELVQLDVSSAGMCFGDGECTKGMANGVSHRVELPEVPCTHEERYKPAYELVDGSLERAGRASSSATTKLMEQQKLRLQNSS